MKRRTVLVGALAAIGAGTVPALLAVAPGGQGALATGAGAGCQLYAGDAQPQVPPVVARTSVCVLDVVSRDIAAGIAPQVAFVDAARRCFGLVNPAESDVADVHDLWNVARAAQLRVSASDADVGQ